MWGSDFPHPRCTFPNSEKIVDETFGGLPMDVQEDLSFYNAARFYDIAIPEAGRIITA